MNIGIEERLVRVKLMDDCINKNKTRISPQALRYMEFMKFMTLNAHYGIRPRGYGLSSFLTNFNLHTENMLKQLSSIIEDGNINFDNLYNSRLYYTGYNRMYKIFEIEPRRLIYFLGTYSHLKYHINFSKLREGVPNDFKYRASYNRSRRSIMV